jgi:hypothetical protein
MSMMNKRIEEYHQHVKNGLKMSFKEKIYSSKQSKEFRQLGTIYTE